MLFNAKLDRLVVHHIEMRDLLACHDMSDLKEFARLSKEYSDLTRVAEAIESLRFKQKEKLDLEEMLNKLNQFSSLSARMRQQQGRSASLWKAIGHGLWTFLRGYVIKLGFLDGREGFLLAVSNAEGSYYRYLKLMYFKSGI